VLDASGNVIGRQAHLPFGEDFAESGTQDKHHFTSYERDGESGLDYAVNRHMQSVVGRFLQADKAKGEVGSPQSWNRLTYNRNEPINLTDSNGLFFSVCWHSIIFGFTFLLDGVEVPDYFFGIPAEFCIFIFFFIPEPEPKPTCTVFVKIKKIKDKPGLVFRHAYLLTQDNQTGAVQYAGARSSKGESGGVGGTLVGSFGDFTEVVADGDFGAKVIASFGKTVVGSGCDAINNSFRVSKDRINARKYIYDPTAEVGQNSNAFSYSLLADYSVLTFAFLIAEVSSLGPTLPGWGKRI
jgi:RHS repeat-associated protein